MRVRLLVVFGALALHLERLLGDLLVGQRRGVGIDNLPLASSARADQDETDGSLSPGIDRLPISPRTPTGSLIVAKLNMLKAFENMWDKGSWVSWPDGQQ